MAIPSPPMRPRAVALTAVLANAGDIPPNTAPGNGTPAAAAAAGTPVAVAAPTYVYKIILLKYF